MPYDKNGEPFDYSEPPSLSETTRQVQEMKLVSGWIVVVALVAAFLAAAGVVIAIGWVIQ